MSDHFISVDWGTSNLRIKLVEIPSLDIVEHLEFNEGIKHVFGAWKATGGDREDYFLHFLKEKLQLFKDSVGSSRIIISGMASSSIGLRELPYAELPFGIDGKGIYFEQITRTDVLDNPISLISGVKGPTEVMRGEEVQLLGLADRSEMDSLFILPGTHSKHIFCSNGKALDFKSYMTGEVFQVMRTHSILSGSVEEGVMNKEQEKAFDEGVRKSWEGNSLLSKLFSVRTNSLFGTRSKSENYYYLSGLLIGDELNSIKKDPEVKIKLCAEGKLCNLYQRAIEKLDLLDHTELVKEEEVKMSVIKGQWELIKCNNW